MSLVDYEATSETFAMEIATMRHQAQLLGK